MAKAYSSEYKSTLAAVSAPESPLMLLQIDHVDLVAPIRVVSDTQNIVSNGNTFIAYPFKFILPSDYENQLPKAKIEISNVGRDLMEWIETSAGAAGTTIRFMQIMRSRPNQIEWEITMSLYNVQVTPTAISGELGFENLFNKPAISIQYRPFTAAAIF